MAEEVERIRKRLIKAGEYRPKIASNGGTGRCHDMVMQLFDRAIAKAEASE